MRCAASGDIGLTGRSDADHRLIGHDRMIEAPHRRANAPPASDGLKLDQRSCFLISLRYVSHTTPPTGLGHRAHGGRKPAVALCGPCRLDTHVYIDGFNLYYGLLKGTPYKWLDLGRRLISAEPQPH